MAFDNEVALYWSGQVTLTWPPRGLMTPSIRHAWLFRSYPLADLMQQLVIPDIGTVKKLTVPDKLILGIR